MRKYRILAAIVCLLLASALLPAAALAATVEKDGLSLNLTTDKSEYEEGETIKISVSLTNVNSVGITGGELELLLPEGLSFESGVETGAVDLPAGGSAEISYTAVTQQAAEVIVPDTGDASAGVWVVLALAAAAAVVVLLLVKRKISRRITSTLLCLALLLTLAPLHALAEENVLTAETTVTVGGKDYTIGVRLGYSLPEPAESEEASVHTVYVNSGSGDGSYKAGDTVTVSAVGSAAGSLFQGWKVVSGGAVLASSSSVSTTFTMPANDVVITAVFSEALYGVSVKNGSGDGNYHAGDTVTITADTAPFSFNNWIVTSGGAVLADSTSGTTTFTMPANAVEISASSVMYFFANGIITTTAGGPSNSYLVGESSGAVIASPSNSFDLSGSPAAVLGQAVPGDMHITAISAGFLNDSPMSLVGTTITFTASIYAAPSGQDVYTLLSGPHLLGAYTGIVASGTSLGIDVPVNLNVASGTKLVLVISASAAGISLANSISGFPAGAITMD